MSAQKKLYFILVVLIILLGTLFVIKFKQTQDIVIKRQTIPLISQNSYYLPIDKNDYIFGNPGAPITVVIFNGFECSDCTRIHNSLYKYINTNPTTARMVWKGLPDSKIFSGTNLKPFQASYCAGQQNKFWQYTDAAMQYKKLGEDDLKKIAENLNLNISKWWTCYSGPASQQPVASSTLMASQLGIKEPPIVFINNRLIYLDESIDVIDILKNFVE